MLLAPELFETDAADKYFISARINHRGQRIFPLVLLFLNTGSVKTLLKNSIFVRYLKYLLAHDTHPARGAGRCRGIGCADAPVQLSWLFSIHQRSGKEDESKNQGEAAGRITAITKHYSSRAQSTKIGCAFSLPATYREERRRAASEAAKKCGVNDIGRSVHKNLL